jgi:hypothetical protein
MFMAFQLQLLWYVSTERWWNNSWQGGGTEIMTRKEFGEYLYFDLEQTYTSFDLNKLTNKVQHFHKFIT